ALVGGLALVGVALACLFTAPYAGADASSLYQGPGPRPGPDLLYEPLADAPQLQNAGAWSAPPILVSGASAYRDGEFLYQDYLYDDAARSAPRSRTIRASPGTASRVPPEPTPTRRALCTRTTPPIWSSFGSSRSPTRPPFGSRSTH